MKKLVLRAAAIIALWGGAAQAADLPRPGPVYYPPVVRYFTWTGCYVGGTVGGVWVTREWFDNAPGLAGTSMGSQDGRGFLAGGQGGCNYQFGSSWVLGIQGDYHWALATGDNTNAILPLLDDRSNLRSLASVTARVGYTADRLLIYVKGGGAWENDDYSILVSGFSLANAGDWHHGWTVGIGGEYAFLDFLTGFLEFDYYDFGTSTSTFNTCTVALCGAVTLPVDIRETKGVVKVGLNFKFGPTPPLVAQY